jgi:hypothetical protein
MVVHSAGAAPKHQARVAAVAHRTTTVIQHRSRPAAFVQSVHAAQRQQTRAAGGLRVNGPNCRLFGDTSGSCQIVSSNVLIPVNTCSAGETNCAPAVFHQPKDSTHPFGFNIIVPSTTNGTAKPASGLFSVIVPKATQLKSIQPDSSIQVTETTSGVFLLRVFDSKGHKLAIWAPPLRLVAPAGFTHLQQMTRAGWVNVNPNRVQTPGLYRWTQ